MFAKTCASSISMDGMLLLICWLGGEVLVDPGGENKVVIGIQNWAFSSPREKIQILIGVVSHACRSRMFRKIWHFEILECTDPDVIISNLEWPFLLNQCPNLSVAGVLGLRIWPSLEVRSGLVFGFFYLLAERMSISLCAIKVLSHHSLFYIVNNLIQPIFF